MFAENDRLSRVQKMEQRDKKSKFNNPFPALEGFNGPIPRKGPTDKRWIIPMVIFFLIFALHSFYGT